ATTASRSPTSPAPSRWTPVRPPPTPTAPTPTRSSARRNWRRPTARRRGGGSSARKCFFALLPLLRSSFRSLEQLAHRLVPVDALDGLGEDGGDAEDAEVG